MNDKLDGKEHIEYVSSKFSKAITFMFKSKMLLDKHFLHNLMFIILLYINYCTEIWGNAYK